MQSNLQNKLIKLIKAKGSISVAEFMQLCLFDVEHGYYNRKDPFGEQGDFITAPETSQMFGEMLGIWCLLTWQQLGINGKFSIVEMGPGRGTLMLDLLRATQHVPEFIDNVSIHLIEKSPHLTRVQKATLEKYTSRFEISWHEELTELKLEQPILFIANELFDALPVVQYQKQNDNWYERRIVYDDNLGFTFNLSSRKIKLPKHKNAKDGAIVEICPLAQTIIAQLAELISQNNGAAIFIDYGYIKNEYRSTLQAVKSHQYHDIFEDVGNADLTCLVDFAELCDIAKEHKLEVVELVTQAEFLKNMGIELRLQNLLQNAGSDQQEILKRQFGRLVDVDKMGELFKVMILQKGVK